MQEQLQTVLELLRAALDARFAELEQLVVRAIENGNVAKQHQT